MHAVTGPECVLAERLAHTSNKLFGLHCRQNGAAAPATLLDKLARETRPNDPTVGQDRACVLLWTLGIAYLQRTHGALASEAVKPEHSTLWRNVYNDELKLQGCVCSPDQQHAHVATVYHALRVMHA